MRAHLNALFQPGDLMQIDTLFVSLTGGAYLEVINTLDIVSRKA